MSTETTFEVAATPDSLDEVQDRFATWWDGLGIDDVRLRFALETALAEVAANIVEHTVRADRGPGAGTPCTSRPPTRH